MKKSNFVLLIAMLFVGGVVAANPSWFRFAPNVAIEAGDPDTALLGSMCVDKTGALIATVDRDAHLATLTTRAVDPTTLTGAALRLWGTTYPMVMRPSGTWSVTLPPGWEAGNRTLTAEITARDATMKTVVSVKVTDLAIF